MTVDPFRYTSPTTTEEIISLANGHAYEWGYVDAARVAEQDPERVAEQGPVRVPDGWPWAWLEYTRRNPSRMSIQDAFTHWVTHSTLPGLS
ncbi:MAG TPA: hypothetical protein VM677_01505 [Actinokineospora sp.]|jgi:hypothetical protein|nr:hypothetical protein [Actinokineospora sp.]